MKPKIKVHPWQEKILVDLESGSWKAGELSIMMSGRGTGKSVFSSYTALQRLWQEIENRPVEDLILSEGKVHGARYHCVSPVGGKWHEMELWCRETFGEPGDMWDSDDWCWPESARWLQNNRKFWFRQEKDRTLFILRWR